MFIQRVLFIGPLLLVGVVPCFALLPNTKGSAALDDIFDESEQVNPELVPLIERWRASASDIRNGLKQPERNKGTQCGILWYYHIPKTGGTSIARWIEGLRLEGFVSRVYPVLNMRPPFRAFDFARFFEEELSLFLAHPGRELVAVHHHHRAPGLAGDTIPWALIKQRLEAHGCSLFRFTTLREPVSRTMSLLYYSAATYYHIPYSDRNRWIINNLQQILRESCGQTDNGQIRYILHNFLPGGGRCPPPAIGEDELHNATVILDEFEALVRTEHMDEDMLAFATKAGVSSTHAWPVPRANSNPHPDPSEMPPEMMLRIRELSRFDELLHSSFTSKLAQHAEE